ncbi:SPOR domain-containing protein [Plastoroseomonas hellenica]|uniref:SPOR domain-containing protein n=1 Tax=Plastoroseomonas hellenica TaxID=2687306 RepID=UPI003463132F
MGFALIGGMVICDVLDSPPGSVPVIEADRRPIRVRPVARGGLQVENQDALIFDREPRAQGVMRLSPEPEEPRPDLLGQLVAQPSEISSAAATEGGQEDAPAVTTSSVTSAPGLRADTPATDGVQVQIGALPSAAAAEKEWARLTRRVPALFRDLEPQVSRFERNGQAPLFRLRTGPLPDAETAQEFCGGVRAAGGNCFVVLAPTT